ncbi:MAG: hypothetical protein JXO72_02000 [Vicinamibacteria bacterium]|nr:hypothetical protein [Vicinamibacteria bacterium]
MPPIETRQALQGASGLTGRVRVSVRGPGRRGRATILVGFRRPDALRVEIPLGVGQRLVVVTRSERLCAIFPAERAVFRGPADAASVEAALGVALTPSEVMDLIVGAPPARLTVRRVRWRQDRPHDVAVLLPDGTDLKMKMDEIAFTPPAAAVFEEPALPGYRSISADEARSFWERP